MGTYGWIVPEISVVRSKCCKMRKARLERRAFPGIRIAPKLGYWYWMYSGVGCSFSRSAGVISGSPLFVSLW